jgi:hypothetical protein
MTIVAERATERLRDTERPAPRWQSASGRATARAAIRDMHAQGFTWPESAHEFKQAVEAALGEYVHYEHLEMMVMAHG